VTPRPSISLKAGPSISLSAGRIGALLGKELTDLRKNPSVFLPAIITGLMAIFLPFFVAVIIPAFTGERLSDSSDFEVAMELYRDQPGLRGLDPEAAVQAWIFQQFLILLVITPVAASMSVAAYSVIGEKQARTLEPLLATPITTFELLAAKVAGSLIPALALTFASFAVYVVGAAIFARPGVFRALLTGRSLMIVFLLGPLAALAALQMAVCVSSRVNDARSAQQIGALVILPVTGLLIAQVTGSFLLTGAIILLIALGLGIINAALMALGVALFERESILTRWK
jgi:ABC-2 type transport system permease protein